MSETAAELRARLTELLADGRFVDWALVTSGGLLTQAEIEAFKLLERAGASRGGGDLAPVLEDGFEIVAELGRGATSRVYLARDKALQRDVALKVLAPAPGLPELARARFVAEARALAAVEHPHVVRIHSIRADGDSLRLVLELVRGETLEQRVRRLGRLPQAEATRIGLELCDALGALHARGLVHRDIKPNNVMSDERGRTVLLDFGLARSSTGAAGWSWSAFAGTPLFMAPEQFEGREPLGPATDVYGTAALLYWLVSVRHPCEAATREDMRARVVAGEATPLAAVAAGVDRRWAAVVERGLSRDPSARHASVSEFARDLQRAQARSGAAGRLRRAVSLAVALTLVAAVALWARSRTREQALIEDCALFLRAGALARPLDDGDGVQLGDQLFLRLRPERPAHVYVFDVDARGETYALFPLAGFDLANPLAAGRMHDLPGKLGGELHDWRVTSDGGGAEWIVAVAAETPIAEIEALLARAEPARPGAPVNYPSVAPTERTALLRGVGGVTPAAASSAATAPAAWVDALEELERTSRGSVWVRVFALRTTAK